MNSDGGWTGRLTDHLRLSAEKGDAQGGQDPERKKRREQTGRQPLQNYTGKMRESAGLELQRWRNEVGEWILPPCSTRYLGDDFTRQGTRMCVPSSQRETTKTTHLRVPHPQLVTAI